MTTTAAVALPATRIPAPSTDWALTGYKEIKMRCEVAYSAKLRHFGVLVADVSYDGNGGTPFVDWRPGKRQDHQAQWDAWARGFAALNNARTEFEYEAIEALATECQVLTQLKRDGKKYLLALKSGMDPITDGYLRIATTPTVEAATALHLEFTDYFDGSAWAPIPRDH